MARLIRFSSLAAILACAACASSHTDIAAGRSDAATRVTGIDGVSEIEQARAIEVVEAAIDAPLTKTWESLPDVYLALGLPVGTMDSQRKSIGNANFRARKTLAGKPLGAYFRCGMNAFGMDNADSYTVTLRIITQVVSVDATHSRLRSLAQASASRESMSEHPITCTSTGALERAIAMRTQERVVR